MSRSATVDFTLRANISDLKSELGKIPGITDKEARKMAGAMEKGLLRAEKAAKRAGQAMRGDLGKSVDKAIEKTRGLATAAGVSEESFNKLKTSAGKVAGTVDGFADKAGRADSSLSAMAGAIHNVNPELAEMTRQAGDALGAVEGLILAAAQSPVTFGMMALTVGALYLAFGDANEEFEKNQKLAAAQDKVHKRLNSAASLHTQTTEKLSQKLAIQRGELSQLSFTWKENEQDITAVVARYQKLANQGHVTQEMMRDTQAWAIEQRAANDELFRTNKLLEDTAKKSKEAATATKLVVEMTDQRIVRLRGSIHYLEKSGQAERAAYAEQEIAALMLENVTEKWAAREAAATGALLSETDGNEKLTSALKMSDESYKDLLQDTDLTRRSLNELTNETWAVIDARGREVHSLYESSAAYAVVRDDHETAIGLLNKETGEIYNAAEAVLYETQIKKKAAADSVAAAEAATQARNDATQARIDGADKEIAAISKTLKAAQHADYMQVLSDEERIDVVEQRSLAELQLVADKFKSEEALTADRAQRITEIEGQIRDEASRQRWDLEEQRQLESIESWQTWETKVLKAHKSAAAGAIDAMKEAAAEREQIQISSMNKTAELAGALSSFMMDQAEERSAKERDLAMRDFQMSQAAAGAEAVINGALAITDIWKAHAHNPIVAGALSAATAGIVGMQIAKIASTEPSFDVGGIIAPASGGMARTPDQVQIRALPGEAVLNRQAVDRLGASGVDRLNTGGAPPVVVRPVSSFKHFDRFTKAEFRRSGYFRSLFDQDREFAPGQRSY